MSIPRAPNTGTCIQQGDLFYSAGLCGPTQEPVLATAYTGKMWERFRKPQYWCLFRGQASELQHILLHALRLKDLTMVQMVCRAGANVNLPINLQNYLKVSRRSAQGDIQDDKAS